MFEKAEQINKWWYIHEISKASGPYGHPYLNEVMEINKANNTQQLTLEQVREYYNKKLGGRENGKQDEGGPGKGNCRIEATA